MPETTAPPTSSRSQSHQPISLPVPPHPGGAGGDEQRLMSTTAASAEERRQKFLFISRRTTTTVFAKHDEDRLLVGDSDIAPTKQQLLHRRQFSCQHYPETRSSSSSSSNLVSPVVVVVPVETHFEWNGNGKEREEEEKKDVSNQRTGGSGGQQPNGRLRSKDNIILNVAGPVTRQNKIRLKIVW